MTIRLAILCPDPENPAYIARVQPPIDGYRQLFERLGVEVIAHPWVRPLTETVDGVLASLAWGYHFRPDDWRAMLAGWDPSVPLLNPPEALLWNTDKRYLRQLADLDVTTIPTLMPALTTADEIAAAFETFGVDRLVIKPLISAGSHETVLLDRGDAAPAPAGGRMIQPYLAGIAEEGEMSLFFFGGAFSHAVVKVAAPGDFRVQPQFGGRLSALVPDAEAMALAQATLAAAPPGFVYARIDMVRSLDGRLALMELEAIEPDLYFAFAPEAGLGFGRAVLDALKDRA